MKIYVIRSTYTPRGFILLMNIILTFMRVSLYLTPTNNPNTQMKSRDMVPASPDLQPSLPWFETYVNMRNLIKERKKMKQPINYTMCSLPYHYETRYLFNMFDIQFNQRNRGLYYITDKWEIYVVIMNNIIMIIWWIILYSNIFGKIEHREICLQVWKEIWNNCWKMKLSYNFF